jgi:hypothetical protein
MQRIPLGVLAGTCLALVMYSSGRVGQPLEPTASDNHRVVVAEHTVSNHSMAKSMDSSMALSNRNLAVSRPARSEAVSVVPNALLGERQIEIYP